MLANINSYSKMTSVLMLYSVTLFLRLKEVTCDTVQLLAGFLQCNGRKFDETEDFKMCFHHLLCVNIKIDQL